MKFYSFFVPLFVRSNRNLFKGSEQMDISWTAAISPRADIVDQYEPSADLFTSPTFILRLVLADKNQ